MACGADISKPVGAVIAENGARPCNGAIGGYE
jgi:hypothetical protein